jgi:hypothetical protein
MGVMLLHNLKHAVLDRTAVQAAAAHAAAAAGFPPVAVGDKFLF